MTNFLWTLVILSTALAAGRAGLAVLRRGGSLVCVSSGSEAEAGLAWIVPLHNDSSVMTAPEGSWVAETGDPKVRAALQCDLSRSQGCTHVLQSNREKWGVVPDPRLGALLQASARQRLLEPRTQLNYLKALTTLLPTANALRANLRPASADHRWEGSPMYTTDGGEQLLSIPLPQQQSTKNTVILFSVLAKEAQLVLAGPTPEDGYEITLSREPPALRKLSTSSSRITFGSLISIRHTCCPYAQSGVNPILGGGEHWVHFLLFTLMNQGKRIISLVSSADNRAESWEDITPAQSLEFTHLRVRSTGGSRAYWRLHHYHVLQPQLSRTQDSELRVPFYSHSSSGELCIAITVGSAGSTQKWSVALQKVGEDSPDEIVRSHDIPQTATSTIYRSYFPILPETNYELIIYLPLRSDSFYIEDIRVCTDKEYYVSRVNVIDGATCERLSPISPAKTRYSSELTNIGIDDPAVFDCVNGSTGSNCEVRCSSVVPGALDCAGITACSELRCSCMPGFIGALCQLKEPRVRRAPGVERALQGGLELSLPGPEDVEGSAELVIAAADLQYREANSTSWTHTVLPWPPLSRTLTVRGLRANSEYLLRLLLLLTRDGGGYAKEDVPVLTARTLCRSADPAEIMVHRTNTSITIELNITETPETCQPSDYTLEGPDHPTVSLQGWSSTLSGLEPGTPYKLLLRAPGTELPLVATTKGETTSSASTTVAVLVSLLCLAVLITAVGCYLQRRREPVSGCDSAEPVGQVFRPKETPLEAKETPLEAKETKENIHCTSEEDVYVEVSLDQPPQYDYVGAGDVPVWQGTQSRAQGTGEYENQALEQDYQNSTELVQNAGKNTEYQNL